MQPRAICVWGDSIAKGVVFDENRRRYVILKDHCLRMLQCVLPIPVVNHGVMGCTAKACLETMEQVDMIPGGVAVIEFGGNDSDMDWRAVAQAPTDAHPARSSLAEYADSLRGIVRTVRDGGMTPVIVPPLPLDGEKYFQWVSRGLDGQAILQYLGDAHMMYRWQEQYADAARDVAAQEKAALLDVRGALLGNRSFYRFYCLDGIHLNEAGHRAIYEYVLPRAQACMA